MKKGAIKLIVLVILAAFASMVLSGCNDNSQGAENNDKTQRVYVEVESPVNSDIEVDKEFSGKLRPIQEIMVFPKIPGKVSKLYVTVGQVVKKDALLLELDGTDVNTQVAQAQAGYDSAEASIELSRERLNYLREQQKILNEGIASLTEAQKKLDESLSNLTESLVGLEAVANDFISGSITLEQLNQRLGELGLDQTTIDMLVQRIAMEKQLSDLKATKAQIDSAIMSLPFDEKTLNAQSKQAKAVLGAAQNPQKGLKLYSPINGVVSGITVVEGGMAAQTMPPVTVINMDKLLLDINLNEFEVAKVKAGDSVILHIDALSEDVTGIIDWVSPAVDQRTQSYGARITLDNTGGRVKPGMFARATIPMDRAEKVLNLSKDGLIREGDKYFAFVVTNSKAEKREVKIALDNGERVQVISGLNEGDSIVIKGQEYLEDGVEVEIVRGEGK